LTIVVLLLLAKPVYAQVRVTDFSNTQFELSNGDVVCLGALNDKISETIYDGLHIIGSFHVTLLPHEEILYVFPEEHHALTLSLNDSGLVFIAYTTFWQPKDSLYSFDTPFKYRSKYIDKHGVNRDVLMYNWTNEESSYTKYTPYKFYHVYVDKEGNTKTKITYEFNGPDISEMNTAEFCNRLDSLLNINDEELIWFTMFNESMYMLFYGALNNQERCIYYLQNLLEVCRERGEGVTSEMGGESLMVHRHLKELYNGLMGNPIPLPFYTTEPYLERLKKDNPCK